jgi:hypothetical protein
MDGLCGMVFRGFGQSSLVTYFNQASNGSDFMNPKFKARPR